ncbi:aromatic ring-hydroxylating dioxygenase subunit alpha [Paraburkholderia elongata]|uniref:Rieske 2Fe-2S domain-containing protein n=1 Tax=Paraburkholderia elongata TaxID=2675747 RepID=A0A972P1J2_9BURK|nr:aromatic ring-hydroxylating dioxygenase subunit alpha [Paraburkholderia elongata]NPT61637.1 Rieske 2Fe-2S domain-containing protein [Paraburkholderia elongata]
MNFLQNAWHMVGWSHELGDSGFVHRTIANEPVLIYRLQDGSPAAILDRCPHRFVPLHLGKQVGDTVQCGYHGLCFDKTGACVKNPVDGAPIPKAAKVKSYPVIERFGGFWIWMGDPDLADESALPDYEFLVDPKRAAVHGYMITKANYQLTIDNLTDLTHIQFVHGKYQGSEAYPRIVTEVKQVGNTVFTYLTFPNGRSPMFYANALPDPEQPIDLVYEVRWDPPSNAKLTARGYAVGDRSKKLFEIQSAHIITAETDLTCHYFFCNSRDYAVGDEAADQKVRDWQRIGFIGEDKPMLEAQQLSIGNVDIMDLKPVLLGFDGGAMRVRRTLQALIDAEQKAKIELVQA